MYVYRQEGDYFAVGFYIVSSVDHEPGFYLENYYDSRLAAEKKVNYLNGGSDLNPLIELLKGLFIKPYRG